MARAIITYNICPPIPIREYDWCAYFDGEESSCRYGYGRTEAEAKQDLLDNYDDEDEALTEIAESNEAATDEVFNTPSEGDDE